MLVVPNMSKRIPSCVWSCLILAADLGVADRDRTFFEKRKGIWVMDFHMRGNLRKNATRPTWWQTKELHFFLLPFCVTSDLCILLTCLHPDVLEHPGISLKFLSLIVLYQPVFFSNICCLWVLEDTKKFSLRIYSIQITFSGWQGMEREGGGGRAQAVFSWGKNC